MERIEFTEEELRTIRRGQEAKNAIKFWEPFLNEAQDWLVEEIIESGEDEVGVRERAAMKLKLIRGFKNYLLSLVNEAEALHEMKEDEKVIAESEPF